jgi:DnaJ-class molecular chaperone
MNATKDYYTVLGVSPSADEVALGAAYRTLLKKYHPDVFRGSREEAEARTREIVEAYDTLRDSAKRRAYDAARTNRRPENAGCRPRGTTNASEGVTPVGALRSNPNAGPNRARSNPGPFAQKSLWPMVAVGILCLLLAAKLLYYGL